MEVQDYYESKHKLLKKRKAQFLKAYGEWGTLNMSCRVAKVPRGTYARWITEDPVFMKQIDEQREIFADTLEELAFERVKNPDKGKGSDILLIALLNANRPQKYRPQFAMSEDTAKDLIFEWRKAAKDMKKEAAEKPAELPGNVENTLQEILERRGNAPKEKEGE